MRLSASIGAPGPRDFAVRNGRCPSCTAAASTASHLNVRDDAYAPRSEAGREEHT